MSQNINRNIGAPASISSITIERVIPHLTVQGIFDATIWGSRGYSIYSSDDAGITWSFLGTMAIPSHKQLLSSSRMISRLLRRGIGRTIQTSKDSILIFCDGAFFHTDLSFSFCSKSALDTKALQLLDHSVCVVGDKIYYGEYSVNVNRNQVNIYVSDDCDAWELLYSFPARRTRHVHLLQYDPFSKRIWFSTGDSKRESLLGHADLDFSDVQIVGENSLQWRGLELFFYQEEICWGTDTPHGQNRLLSMDRTRLETREIALFDGPIYNLKQIPGAFLVITANERGQGQWDNCAHLWASTALGGQKWEDLLACEKDWLPNLFGFGRLLFGGYHANRLFLTGLALRRVDNKTLVLKLQN
jgi:hypothetical protein